MRAVSSGTGGTGCDRRSDMDDLRTRDSSNARALRKAADFATGVRSFPDSHNGVVFLPVQLELPLRFNPMAASSVIGADACPRASAPAPVQEDAEGPVSSCCRISA